jgi:DNA-binding transcriptional ArsR family regulator
MSDRKRSGKKSTGAGRKKRNPKPKKPRRPKRPSGALLDYRKMHALSEEKRVRILALLCERVASPKEISDELNEGLSQVSYHVSVLRECRLITLDRKVPRRGAVEHFYRAAVPTLIPPGAWGNVPPAMLKTVSLGILQEFFEEASASIEAEVFDSPPGELCLTPLVLDALGVKELGQLSRDFLESVLELQARVDGRIAKGDDNASAATVFLASFLSARSPEDGKKASAARRR